MRKRLLIHWQNLPGYVAASLACFRRRHDVDTLLLYDETDGHAPFDRSAFADLGEVRNVTGASAGELDALMSAFRPSVGLVTGWTPMSRLVATRLARRGVPTIAASDNIRSRSWIRQRALPLYWRLSLRRLFARYWVPGIRGREYLEEAGVPPSHIATGVYATDARAFERPADSAPHGAVKSLIFVGQYIPRKGIPELLEGFEKSGTDWQLTLCGAGPLQPLVADYARRLPNVRDMGFTQPAGLPRLLHGSAAFLFPSREDHWGVAVLEAAAAGLPIICSDVCGAAADLVHDGESGFLVRPESADTLARAIRRLTTASSTELATWGARARELALPYDVTQWSDTLYRLIDELHTERPA